MSSEARKALVDNIAKRIDTFAEHVGYGDPDVTRDEAESYIAEIEEALLADRATTVAEPGADALRFWQLPSDEPTYLYVPWDSDPRVVRGNGGDEPCWTVEEVERLLAAEHAFCIEVGDDPSDLYALEITVKRIPYRSRPQENDDER